MADFRVLLSQNRLISGWQYPEVGRFPGIVTRRSNFEEKKTWIFFILNSYKSFKTEYIYTNQLWTICTYIELWFEGKIHWGHLRTIFATSRYQEVENISWISPWKRKYFRKYFGLLIWGLGSKEYEEEKTELENLMLLSL